MIFSVEQQLSEESTFSELSQWYFDFIAPRTLKEHTVFNNHMLMKNYVIPYIGDLPVREITPVLIDELLSFLPGSGAIRKCSLTATTVQQIRIVLSSIFQTAVRKEILGRNPVTLSTKIRCQKKERIFLDENSCRKVLFLCDSLANPQIANAIRLLLYTGMRRGELIGLQWSDVNFSMNELYVRRTISQFDGRYVVTTPKTASSSRTINLCPSAVDLLKDQMRIFKREYNVSLRTDGDSPVFFSKNGACLSGAYLNNCFRRMMADAGMPGYHLHDLRHANASILINNGVPMKIVSSHLGHSSSAVTEVFYTHLFQNSLQITADVIEKRMTQDSLTK